MNFEVKVIVFIPCANEAKYLPRTISSLMRQTRPPNCIIVGDHNSDDGSGDIARKMGCVVVKCTSPIKRKGAVLQTIYQSDEFRRMISAIEPEQVIIVVIDADSILDVHALEKLLEAFKDPRVGSASGLILPAELACMWQKARLTEYVLSGELHKKIQAGFSANLVCSGCLAAIRLNVLHQIGGFPTTLSEDMDVTWMIILNNWKSEFVPEALAYTAEPPSLPILIRQLSRWSRGFFECVKKHWSRLVCFTNPSLSVFVIFWLLEGLSSFFLLTVTFFLMIKHEYSCFLLALLIVLSELALTGIPVLIGGVKQKMARAILYLPHFYLLRLVAICVWWRSFWEVIVMRRTVSYSCWNKGH